MIRYDISVVYINKLKKFQIGSFAFVVKFIQPFLFPTTFSNTNKFMPRNIWYMLQSLSFFNALG